MKNPTKREVVMRGLTEFKHRILISLCFIVIFGVPMFFIYSAINSMLGIIPAIILTLLATFFLAVFTVLIASALTHFFIWLIEGYTDSRRAEDVWEFVWQWLFSDWRKEWKKIKEIDNERS
jgi:hypothetical protein